MILHHPEHHAMTDADIQLHRYGGCAVSLLCPAVNSVTSEEIPVEEDIVDNDSVRARLNKCTRKRPIFALSENNGVADTTQSPDEAKCARAGSALFILAEAPCTSWNRTP